jgi:xanthine dehydrogenase molybdenum-binding subunit
MANKTVVSTTINGEQVEFLCEPHQSLLECLRDVLGLTGTKEGCNDGNCGACSVLLDGRLVNACLVLGVEIEGREVTTVEGLADWRGLHPIQQAFVEGEALQCGYCTPGILIAAKALLDREPDPSEEQIRTWLAGNLCRCTGYNHIVHAVQLVKQRPEVTTTPTKEYAVIGTRPPRYDAVDKVTGRARYGADISFPGLLYGKVLRSPHAHARIQSIDTRRAEAFPGVYAVVTADDLPQAVDRTASAVNFKYLCDNTLASDKVLYVGHAVAAVAASTPHIAEQAAQLIEVEYEVLPAVVDVMEAVQDSARTVTPLLHETMRTRSLAGTSRTPSNVASYFQHVKGDPEKGFAEADVIIEREFRTTIVHQGYIEPHAATAFWSTDGALTVHCTTQGAFVIRDQLAELLRHPLSKIRVVPTEVGGGFGGKGASYVETMAALLSRKAGRPVKVVMSRVEEFLASRPTPGTAIRVKMGATRNGQITAVQAELYYEAGAYPGSPVDAGAAVMFAPYDIPHGRIDGYDVVVNKSKTDAYRAPGATQASFAGEQVIDEVAEKIGMDPLEFRMLNCAREGTRQIDGTVHTDIGCYEVLKAAQEHARYSAPLEGPYRGRGVAHGYWGNWGGQSSCAMSVNADGTVSIITGSVDLSGTRTSLAMQAAEVLGLDLEQIRPTVGDTDSVGYADVSAGSRTTMATGIAVVRAAQDVIAQMSARAALLWDVPADTVSFHQGVFATGQDADKRLTFAELAARLSQTGGPITGVGNVDVPEWGATFGTHIVDVEVDPETGKVTILHHTVVQDVGQAVHPGHVEGQIQGGTVQGIGWALYEGYVYDQDGQLLNPTLLDYKLPTALDVPPIETVIVEVPYSKHPFGVRGVGETPIVSPPAAIANAIYGAIGVRMDQLPMTPDRILEKMGVI